MVDKRFSIWVTLYRQSPRELSRNEGVYDHPNHAIDRKLCQVSNRVPKVKIYV